MQFIKKFLYKIISRKRLRNTEPKEAINSLCVFASIKADKLFHNAYFRDSTNYDKQSKIHQDGYFNEILASFLVLIKLLLLDYDKIRIGGENIRLIADDLYNGFVKFLKNSGVVKEGQKIWLKFLNLKEKNVIREKTDFRNAVFSDSSKLGEKLADSPENMIILASLFDNLEYFSKKGRAKIRNQKFHSFMLQKHKEVFLELEKFLT